MFQSLVASALRTPTKYQGNTIYTPTADKTGTNPLNTYRNKHPSLFIVTHFTIRVVLKGSRDHTIVSFYLHPDIHMSGLHSLSCHDGAN